MKQSRFLSIWNRLRYSAMLYGALGTLVRVGSNTLLLPIVLHRLSASELALWWVLLALGALTNLADFGFGTALTRVYSYLWAGWDDFDTEGMRPPPVRSEPNWPRIRQLHTTARFLYRRLAAVGALLLAVGGTWFLWRSAQASSEPWKVWLVWGAFVLTIGCTMSSLYWIFACQGINRMKDLQAAYLWSGLTYVAVAGILLEFRVGLFSLVVATAARAWVCRYCCRQSFQSAAPAGSEDAVEVDFSMLRRIWPNAWKFGVLSLGAYLIFNSGVLISSQFLGDEVTASYGLTTQVGAFIANIGSLWLMVKWPEITILRSQGKVREMAVLFARRLGWVMATFAILAIALTLFGNRVLEWKGANTGLLPLSYLVVYLVYLGQQQFYIQFGTLTFTENVVPFFKISLFTGIGLVLLSIVGTKFFGLWGLIVAPLLATLVCSSWYPVWRGFQGQPLTVREFARASIYGHP